MTVYDVDLVRSGNDPGFIVDPSEAQERLTIQHFNDRDPVATLVAPHNSDARLSDSVDWPLDLIFDVAYGCAALTTWGVPEFKEFACIHTQRIYYNDGDNNGNKNGDSGDGGPSDNGQGGRRSQQIIDCDAQTAKQAQVKDSGQQASSTADSEAPNIADMVLGLWMHNARKVQHQAHAMKADRTREKVGKWLASAE